MAGGRPRIYGTEQEMQDAVDGYFKHIQGEKQMVAHEGGTMAEVWVRQPEPATVTGLAIFLGFESRQSVYDYEKSGEFSYICKSARLRVECEYEKRLSTATQPTGAIFALKNMGWKDKHETELSGPGGVPLIPPTIQLPDGTNLEI